MNILSWQSRGMRKIIKLILELTFNSHYVACGTTTLHQETRPFMMMGHVMEDGLNISVVETWASSVVQSRLFKPLPRISLFLVQNSNPRGQGLQHPQSQRLYM